MRFASQLAAAAFLLVPAVAPAGPCAPGASPFTDVSAAAGYCTETEWLKNRNITTGCGSATFCPGDFVTRGAMALFLKRLGDALIEPPRSVAGGFGALTLNSFHMRMCQIKVPPVGYPRLFALTGHASALGGSATNTVVLVEVGIDRIGIGSGGLLHPVRMTIDSSWQSSASSSSVAHVPAGESVVFWVGLASGGGSSNAVASGRCALLVQGQSHQTATSSPFDEAEIAAPTN
jgi:hypothetical protein